MEHLKTLYEDIYFLKNLFVKLRKSSCPNELLVSIRDRIRDEEENFEYQLEVVKSRVKQDVRSTLTTIFLPQ